MIHRGRALALAAAAGTLIALCWLPTGLAPVMPLSALLMMRALRAAESRRDAALLGLAFGLLRYAVASHFLLALLRFSGLAVPFYLMAISFILPLAVLEAWGAMVLERWTGLPRSVGFGLLYVVFEKLRTVSDLSFPADLLAHGFGTNPSFLAFAPWFGPFGVSLTVMAVGALLDAAIEAWPRRPVAALRAAAALGLWLAAPAFDAIGVGREAVPRAELTVGIVQPDTPIEQKVRPEKRGEILAQLRAMTLEVVALYNGAVLAEADGSIRQWYGKQRLLPFVEAVPFAGLVGFDARARARSGAHRSVLSLLGNFTPGPEPTVFEIGPARLGVLICYEGFYPALARKYAREGANALAVLTNDSWWGWSAFATWHARMIAARARENELPVVRAANGGISSATDQRGRLGVRSGLAERRVLQVPLAPARGGPTFYARFGDWILIPLSLAPIAAYVRKKRA
ncbi:MAG: apolipoprotein N-acyltransferase [Acidobacteria bacterium]|nr:apolipoprotein N-acyltransferase [Acidobacteriota bacterium]